MILLANSSPVLGIWTTPSRIHNAASEVVNIKSPAHFSPRGLQNDKWRRHIHQLDDHFFLDFDLVTTVVQPSSSSVGLLLEHGLSDSRLAEGELTLSHNVNDSIVSSAAFETDIFSSCKLQWISHHSVLSFQSRLLQANNQLETFSLNPLPIKSQWHHCQQCVQSFNIFCREEVSRPCTSGRNYSLPTVRTTYNVSSFSNAVQAQVSQVRDRQVRTCCRLLLTTELTVTSIEASIETMDAVCRKVPYSESEGLVHEFFFSEILLNPFNIRCKVVWTKLAGNGMWAY